MPVAAAGAYQAFKGQPRRNVDLIGGYARALLHMIVDESHPAIDSPLAIRAIDVFLIANADHEQDCSATTLRCAASSDADLFAAIAAGLAAKSGPLHGRLNEKPPELLRKIGRPEKVRQFVSDVQAGKEQVKGYGFGHRIYGKNVDPRANALRPHALRLAKTYGRGPIVDVALELERTAWTDPFFLEHSLYPSGLFYATLIWECLGVDPEMFTALASVGRNAGWTAQWLDSLIDRDRTTVRPHQIYTGLRGRQLSAPY